MDKRSLPDRLEITCYNRMCKELSNLRELLICIRCRKCFHAKCCDPPVIYSIAARYPWECNKCKACFSCSKSLENEDTTLLICDACDRAYHMGCTKEHYEEVPRGKWYCDFCSGCGRCGRHLSEDESNVRLL
ncbi:bifunctional Zinc finger [Babesia duncani]|uniref:Bifunctional Zinc finger n=1 Tax=Babesia duncani TaxID=323732 RepID=A0AAD9PIW4_9APIC|nr:bifunctional Zinc finger [Babesia duncani]